MADAGVCQSAFTSCTIKSTYRDNEISTRLNPTVDIMFHDQENGEAGVQPITQLRETQSSMLQTPLSYL